MGDVRCIPISIVDDTKVENDEQFNFTLDNGQGTQFNETNTRIYILEDDGMFISRVHWQECATHNTSLNVTMYNMVATPCASTIVV